MIRLDDRFSITFLSPMRVFFCHSLHPVRNKNKTNQNIKISNIKIIIIDTSRQKTKYIVCKSM